MRPVEQPVDLSAQYGQEFGFEPRILLEPSAIAPGGMGQGDNARQAGALIDIAPVPHRLGQPAGGLGSVELPALRILADQDNQFYLRQMGQNFAMPGWRAFAPRRQISALGVIARKAEAHGDDGDFFGVVEYRVVQTEPVAQPVARSVGEGAARGVGAGAGCLPDNADARQWRCLDDGAGLMRQLLPKGGCVAADATGAYADQQCGQVGIRG